MPLRQWKEIQEVLWSSVILIKRSVDSVLSEKYDGFYL